MPVLARHEGRVGVGVDGDDLRVIVQAGDGAVDRQFAEGAAERLVLVVGRMLVAEEEDLMVGDGADEVVALVGRKRTAHVDAVHLRADAQSQRAHLDCPIGHCRSNRGFAPR